jgi:hypothetical protein
VVSGVFNGISVVFLLCRSAEAGDMLARDLGAAIEADLERTDHAVIPYTAVVAGASRPAPLIDHRVLLSVQVRTPDRPGALQQLLAELQARISEAVHERALEPLDPLYAITPVVDGHALAGRFVLRLPRHPSADDGAWDEVQWPDVGRAVAQRLATGAGARDDERTASYDRTAQLSDDTVVTLDLIRAGVPG